MKRSAWLAMAALLVAGCVDTPEVDAGPTCADDSECDDGVWCNGAETCCPGCGPPADDFGCSPGYTPCESHLSSCDEESERCLFCETEHDVDGDGAWNIPCGGDDCDDADPRRSPAFMEVCDPDMVDEDCDGVVNEGCP